MANLSTVRAWTTTSELTSSDSNNIQSRFPYDEFSHANSTLEIQPLSSSQTPVARRLPLHQVSSKPSKSDDPTSTGLILAWVAFGFIGMGMIAAIICCQQRARLRERRERLIAAPHIVRPDPIESETETVVSRRKVPKKIIATFPRYTYWISDAVGEVSGIEEETAEAGQAEASGGRRETIRSEGGRSEDARSNDSSQGSSTSVKSDSSGQNRPGFFSSISQRVSKKRKVAKEAALQQQQPRQEQNTNFPVNPWRQNECSICLQQFENGYSLLRRLPCNHVFHSRCITIFLSVRSNICPVCRKSVLPPEMLNPENAEETTHRPWREYWIVAKMIDWYEESGVVYIWAGVTKGSRAAWRLLRRVEDRVLERNLARDVAAPAT